MIEQLGVSGHDLLKGLALTFFLIHNHPSMISIAKTYRLFCQETLGFIFNLLIFPPQPLLSQVNELRERYDPKSAADCDAHISLTLPIPKPLNRSDWNELELIASGIKPFSINYGPLKNYLPHPGVCLAIEPQEKLDRLRIALEGASVFEGAPKRRFPFSAHMTIAEFITVEQTKQLMIELMDAAPTGDFICATVSYAVPDVHFRFTERARLTLM